MTDEERVQEALAAHIQHTEFGGPAPDTSHLTPAEVARLNDLIALLDQTEGVMFDRGTDGDIDEPSARTEVGQRTLDVLRDVLSAPARVVTDFAATQFRIEGMNVLEGWVVGTFGGRVRLWLLGDEGALEQSDRWLKDLGRLFRLFSDTSAILLVEPDLSCLLVQPEDCAPTIEVPAGSLVGRRYRRPVHPVGDALSVFLRELTPYWEPMQRIADEAQRAAIEVTPIAKERAELAIEEQVAAGKRARQQTKKAALTELTDRDARNLLKLVVDVHQGRANADDIEEQLRKLASR
jgi:hypothetical protein